MVLAETLWLKIRVSIEDRFVDWLTSRPDWVSDLFCLCVSGGDSSQRARYYDSKEFNSKFKHNLILSTIHQVLKESDAVDREQNLRR
jgi:hypothetical protein